MQPVIILMEATELVLIASTSPLAPTYDLLLSTPVEVSVGEFEIAKPLLS